MKNKFNKNQEKAVKWGKGPCLVLAGPGSGKTFVITNRVLNLIVKEGVDASNILVLTFTRAAANEMKVRFMKLLDDENIHLKDTPSFGTFHSIFFEILKEEFGYNNDSLIDENEGKKLLFEVIENFRDIKPSIDLANNILVDIKEYKTAKEREEKYIPKYLSSNLFNRVYEAYEEKLFNNKKLDFYDMVDKCNILLSEHDDILRFYQEKYKYILIDEFQDINKSQYNVIKKICKNQNIFVVGDDDQSIYRFRGSHPRVMTDFLHDYRKSKTIYLNENYRCAKVIVKFSKLVIEKNKERFSKDLVSCRNDVGKLEIKAFVDSKQENEYLIDLIKDYISKGINLTDIAILYRTNLIAYSIKIALNKNNIPYKVKGEDINVYDNFAVKDAIAYLKLAIDNTDTNSFMLIANKPLRYISREAIGYKNSSVDNVIKHYKDKDYILQYLNKLKKDLNFIKNNLTALAIHYIRVNIGYDNYLKKYCKEKNIDYEEIEDILNSFEEEAIGHNDISEFIEYISTLSKKKKEITKKNAISLMTFHLSKGLEFKVVILIDVNDGLIPHKKSIRKNDLETERRLFYVAMTRAKDNLHIFFTTRRFGKNFKASRFIIEAVGGKNG